MLGAPLVDSSIGRTATRIVRQDLRVIGRSPEEHIARHILLLVVGLLWAPATFGLMALGGVNVSWALPVWVSLIFGTIALVIPTLAVRRNECWPRSTARCRRRISKKLTVR